MSIVVRLAVLVLLAVLVSGAGYQQAVPTITVTGWIRAADTRIGTSAVTLRMVDPGYPIQGWSMDRGTWEHGTCRVRFSTFTQREFFLNHAPTSISLTVNRTLNLPGLNYFWFDGAYVAFLGNCTVPVTISRDEGAITTRISVPIYYEWAVPEPTRISTSLSQISTGESFGIGNLTPAPGGEWVPNETPPSLGKLVISSGSGGCVLNRRQPAQGQPFGNVAFATSGSLGNRLLYPCWIRGHAWDSEAPPVNTACRARDIVEYRLSSPTTSCLERMTKTRTVPDPDHPGEFKQESYIETTTHSLPGLSFSPWRRLNMMVRIGGQNHFQSSVVVTVSSDTRLPSVPELPPTLPPETPDALIGMTVSPRVVESGATANIAVDLNRLPPGTYTVLVRCETTQREEIQGCGTLIEDVTGMGTGSILYPPGGVIVLRALAQLPEAGAATYQSAGVSVSFVAQDTTGGGTDITVNTGGEGQPTRYPEHLPTLTPVPMGDDPNESVNPGPDAFFTDQAPHWERLQVEAADGDNVRATVAWTHVPGALRYEILRDRNLITDDISHLGRNFSWETVGDGSIVEMRVRGAVDGGTDGRTVTVEGLEIEIPARETRYSPWSVVEYLVLQANVLDVSPEPDDTDPLAGAPEGEPGGNLGDIVSPLWGGDAGAWNVLIWLGIALVAGGGTAAAIGKQSGDGWLSPGAMAIGLTVGVCMWAGLAPTLGGLPWEYALTPLLLLAYPLWRAIRSTGVI